MASKQNCHEYEDPACLSCDGKLSVAALSAATTASSGSDNCIVRCDRCGAHNEVRSRPSPGAGAPPEAVVLRLVDSDN